MNYSTSVPIYLQVITWIKMDIISGVLKPGEKLPSGRDLALKYSINPNTANRVYKEMEAQGICFTRRGLGTFVTEDPALIMKIKKEMSLQYLHYFLKGMERLGINAEECIELIREEAHSNLCK
ncbi:MAG: GntR family transcriptional regulator [Blautia sp.]|nr:GntR family transcriptional regulator [Blautia sp.]